MTQHKYTQSASAAVVDAVNAGLDSMFTSSTDVSQLLSAALASDKVSVEQLDEMAVRLRNVGVCVPRRSVGQRLLLLVAQLVALRACCRCFGALPRVARCARPAC